MYTELEVVNRLFNLLDDTGVNSLDEEHPEIPRMRGCYRQAIDFVMSLCGADTEIQLVLRPDSVTGHIMVPEDVIFCRASDPSNYVIVKDQKLYDRRKTSDQNPFVFGKAVTCYAKRRVEIENLPTHMQLLAIAKACELYALFGPVSDDKKQHIMKALNDAMVSNNVSQIRIHAPNALYNNVTIPHHVRHKGI